MYTCKLCLKKITEIIIENIIIVMELELVALYEPFILYASLKASVPFCNCRLTNLKLSTLIMH